MKLISCYIENFGGLSQYTLKFDDGITVIEEPNGFGKTTLAEFIRAMFYGFPRAGRTLDTNIRKHYLPWQGGKYGGNLVFEHNGKAYRIDRTFGAVPRLDTFSLCDAHTRKKSYDFSENIGLELFQLDADSFERSTYMPQIHDETNFTTAGIQAKLGNLVDDTNDINHYDKAIAALRAKRSSLIPYRGNGGSVAQTTEKISALQLELSSAENLYGQLDSKLQSLSVLKEEKAIKDGALARIRNQISQVSQSVARDAIAKQYTDLLQRQKKNTEDLNTLKQTYAYGLPTLDELSQIEPLFDQMIAADTQQVQTSQETEAECFITSNRHKFSNGVPSSCDFQHQQALYQEYLSTKSALENIGFSDFEQEQFLTLSHKFQNHIPDNPFFEECQNTLDHLRDCQSKKRSLQLSEAENLQLQNLRIFFASRIPSDKELEENHKKLNRITSLREENVQIASSQVNIIKEEASARKKSVLLLPCIFLSVIFTILGIVMLVGKSFTIGGICIGFGILAALGSIYLHLKQMVNRELSSSRQERASITPENREKIRANEREISDLEQHVLFFISEFISDSRTLGEKLRDLEEKLHTYTQLQEKSQNMQTADDGLHTEITNSAEKLYDSLHPYFPQDEITENSLSTLKIQAEQFRELKHKKESQETAVQQAARKLKLLEQEINAFLTPYCGQVQPDAFHTSLSSLQRECDTYCTAEKIMSDRSKRLSDRQKNLDACKKAAAKFEGKYKIALDLRDRQSFKDLYADCADYADLLVQVETDCQEVSDFFDEHRSILDAPSSDMKLDLDALTRAEQQISGEIQEKGDQILEMEQIVRTLRAKVDQIPIKQDDLASLKQKRQQDIENSHLLDQTIQFLETSKEALSNSYLGTIRRSFTKYLYQLTGENPQNAVVTSDLNVQMERLGEPRALGYFSIGQSDMVILCMRLALVDALYKDTRPFIILDDPFVNLDDQNTQQALQLLKTVSKEYQIIYLVCNSSRTL